MAAVAAACALAACGTFGTDLDAVIALQTFLPDSGAVLMGDTLRPRARALNGRGDSVAATVIWAALDTAIAAVVDSSTGATLGKQHGTGRIQARVGNLRSTPLTVRVQTPVDSIKAASANVRDTVHFAAGDSLSDTLAVNVFATPADAANQVGRRVRYAATIYPAGATAVTLVPRDTALTVAGGTSGVAVAQVRLRPGTAPDSAVVTAVALGAGGVPVPGTPVTFVVEFRP
jgi:hypothetical protein